MTSVARSGEIPEPTVKSGWEKALSLATAGCQAVRICIPKTNHSEPSEGYNLRAFLYALNGTARVSGRATRWENRFTGVGRLSIPIVAHGRSAGRGGDHRFRHDPHGRRSGGCPDPARQLTGGCAGFASQIRTGSA